MIRNPSVGGSLRIQQRLDQDGKLAAEVSVYFPSTENDLATAISVATSAGITPTIEGASVYAMPPPAHLTTVPISIKDLDAVSVDGRTVHAGPSTPMDKLAAVLQQNNLFLPLREHITDTVVDALADSSPTYFDACLGSLRSHVSAVRVVDSNGTISDLAKDNFHAAFTARSDNTILTRVSFNALPASEGAVSALWLARFYAPFTRPAFAALLKRTFSSSRSAELSKVDISVQTRKLVGGLPVLYATLAGSANTPSPEAAAAKVASAQGGTWPVHVARGYSVLAVSQEALEMGARTAGKLVTSRELEVDAGEIDALLPHLVDVADAAMGVKDDNTHVLPRVSLLLQLSIRSSGQLNVVAKLLMPRKPSDAEAAYMSKFNGVFAPAEDDIQHVSQLAAPRSFFDFKAMLNIRSSAHIPNFSGPTFMAGDDQYEDRAHQYATTSYPPEIMTPYIVAYPQNVSDIVTAISYARSMSPTKNIVARSGGHQYCGLSSGGQNVIVLSMDRFSYVDVGDQDNHVTIGAGTPLTRISEFITAAKLTVPHGECPLVAVGGHTQTGGYGHTLRSFGLLVDYVLSFEIVLADSAEAVTIVRPDLPGGEHEHNNDIFYGVLGGGPGSFGVITQYTFEATRDSDHPHSTGFSCIYGFTKERFANIMDMTKQWTSGIKDKTLQPDMDMMATAISFDLANMLPADWHDRGPELQPPPSDDLPAGSDVTGDDEERVNTTGVPIETPSFGIGLLLLELLYGNKDGLPDTNTPLTKDRFEQMHEKVIKDDTFPAWPFIKQFTSETTQPLSMMCDTWVRNFGTTRDGREFIYPYEKRLNGTFEELDESFVTRFVDLVDRSIHDSDVRVVFQMTLGGGMHSGHENRKYTACQRRDITIGVVYDVFYTNNNQQSALNYQNEMLSVLNDTVPEKDTVRLIWGSYGETNINKVMRNYYDNRALYGRLQNIKKAVDGSDVFHTEFTVQLPANRFLQNITGGMCNIS